MAQEEIKLPSWLSDDVIEDFQPNPDGEDEFDEAKKAIAEQNAAKTKKKAAKQETKVEDPAEEEEEEPETTVEEETDEEDTEEAGKKKGRPSKVDMSEKEVVNSFYNAFSEQTGYSLEDEASVPETIEDFISYVNAIIETNNTPEFASEEVQRLNEYVKNGGSLKNYLSIDATIGEYDIDLESDQKRAVEDLLKRQGFSAEQIKKKVNRIINSGDLEEEAEDAIEVLNEYAKKDKEKLEAEQERAKAQHVAQQKAFINDIITTIDKLDNISGVPLTVKDKRRLQEYMLKPTASGRTMWAEEQSKSTLPFIMSAFFQMDGAKLLNNAKSSGAKNAVDAFRSKLKTAVTPKTTANERVAAAKPFWA